MGLGRGGLVGPVDEELAGAHDVLGATAGKALYGSDFRVGESRGTLLDWPEGFPAEVPVNHRPDWVLPTTHPSAVLRSRQRDEDYARLVADLRVVQEALDR